MTAGLYDVHYIVRQPILLHDVALNKVYTTTAVQTSHIADTTPRQHTSNILARCVVSYSVLAYISNITFKLLCT